MKTVSSTGKPESATSAIFTQQRIHRQMGRGCRILLALILLAVAPVLLLAQVSSVSRRTIQLPGPPPGFFFQTNVAPSAIPQYRPAPVAPAPVDPEKARQAREELTRKTVEFQTQRAENGSATAQYDLGVRYLTGDGVQTNLDLARKWLTLSAAQTNHQAMQKLVELDRKTTAPR